MYEDADKKTGSRGSRGLSLALPVEAQDDVNVDELLRAMREMTISQGNRDVMGSIRKGRNKVPFSLSACGRL